jgi:hypothetical protein
MGLAAIRATRMASSLVPPESGSLDGAQVRKCRSPKDPGLALHMVVVIDAVGN